MCKTEYRTPSQWPGHCSEECRDKRKYLNTNKPCRELKRSDQSRWLKLRYQAFKLYGTKCQLCGSLVGLQVDHIKPKSRYPHLEFDIKNLQILCVMCNRGKGAWDKTDWRSK